MITTQKQWLGKVPWDTVLAINQSHCQAQNVSPLHNAKIYDTARQLWERSVPQSLTLKEVLALCRKCQELGPFTFNNANTFSSIAKMLVEDWTKQLPPVEATILSTTIAHYVAGIVCEKELLQVLKHFGARLKLPEAAPAVAPMPAKPSLQSGAV